MTDANSEVKNGDKDELTKSDEQNRSGDSSQEFAGEPLPVIDVDFEEIADKPLIVVNDPDDDTPAHTAEFVDDGSPQAAPPMPDGPLEKFIKELAELGQGESDMAGVTIMIRRLPDPIGVVFRIPCKREMSLDSMPWSGESTADVHDNIRSTEGGGNYWCQIRNKTGFTRHTWIQLVADPIKPSQRELANARDLTKETEQQRSVDISQQFVNPEKPADRKSAFAEMKEVLEEADEIRELLGANRGDNDTRRVSVTDELKLKIFEKMADRPELQDKLTNFAFGIFEKDERKDKETWVDVAKTIVKNPKETISLLDGGLSLITSLLGVGRRDPASAHTAVRSPINLPPQPVTPTGIVLPNKAAQPSPASETPNEASGQGNEAPAADTAEIEPIREVVW